MKIHTGCPLLGPRYTTENEVIIWWMKPSGWKWSIGICL